MNKTTEPTHFFKKEKRDTPLTIRLPKSTVKKIKAISKKFNYSQSEVIETLVSLGWEQIDDETSNKEKNSELK